jgi:hypothetical protein
VEIGAGDRHSEKPGYFRLSSLAFRPGVTIGHIDQKIESPTRGPLSGCWRWTATAPIDGLQGGHFPTKDQTL